jgi:hypothetical protein
MRTVRVRPLTIDGFERLGKGAGAAVVSGSGNVEVGGGAGVGAISGLYCVFARFFGLGEN